MKPQKKLTTRQEAEALQQAAGQHTVQPQPALEFATPEEMLRHDALHTPVPPGIAQRLEKSLGQTAPPGRSWWKRLFGGSNP